MATTRENRAHSQPSASARSHPLWLTDNLPRFTRGIEAGFAFTDHPEDAHFRWQHVEQLLQQSGDLLDRALQARTEYRDLAARALGVALQITEFDQLDAIHRREQEANYYQLPL